MKKLVLNLGTILNKTEQKQVSGGKILPYNNSKDCESNDGIWYSCVNQCYWCCEPHFNPCAGGL